jgi:hypothetical protein
MVALIPQSSGRGRIEGDVAKRAETLQVFVLSEATCCKGLQQVNSGDNWRLTSISRNIARHKSFKESAPEIFRDHH